MGRMRKKFKTNLALILCAALVAGIVNLPGNGVTVKAEQRPDVSLTQEEEQNLPTGGCKDIPVYKVTDEAVLEEIRDTVPSYESAISFFSFRSQSLFEQGTGEYGYNSLNDDQKEFYESIEASLQAFQNSDATEFSVVSGYYTPFQVEYDPSKLSDNQMLHTCMAFRADHPWLFWLDGIVYGTVGSQGIYMPAVTKSYEQDMAAKVQMEQTILDEAQEYLDAVKSVESTYEKVRIIYNKIIQSINYAYKSDGTTAEDADWAHSIVGVFDSGYRNAVCEGYAKAFAFLLNILDIPNVYVVGTGNGGGHAWNAVSFDGGETYYYMDATWDDRGGKGDVIAENVYKYFAMPKSLFEKSHVPAKNGTGMNWQYELPTLGDDMDYTYYIRYGCYGTADLIKDQTSAREFLKTARVLSPEENCLLLLDDVDMINMVRQTMGITEEYSYSSVKEYGMVIYVDQVQGYEAQTPATTVSFANEKMDLSVDETGEKTLVIDLVTNNSDDYITFYSTDATVAVVKTPYVKAKKGESIQIVVKNVCGQAVIYGKSAAGGATASCTITVKSMLTPTPTPAVDPTPAAEPTPTPVADPTALPTESPTATPAATPVVPTAEPSATPKATPVGKPTAEPSATPKATPAAEQTASPTKEPSATPKVTPVGKPTATPAAEQTASPTKEPSATPKATPVGKPTAEPSATPKATPVGKPTATPAAEQTASPTKEPIATPKATPAGKPTATPAAEQTASPTKEPIATPEATPVGKPTAEPSATPKATPAGKPTATPAAEQTASPTAEPIATPKATPVATQPPSRPSSLVPAETYIPSQTKDTDKDQGDDSEDEEEALEEEDEEIKKGDVITVGNIKYKVTKIKGEKGELAVVGVNAKNLKTIVIPKRVSKDGISFVITAIQKHAFKGCRKVKRLTIKSMDIKTIAKKVFADFNKKVTIKIPKSKSNVYKQMIKKAGFKLK